MAFPRCGVAAAARLVSLTVLRGNGLGRDGATAAATARRFESAATFWILFWIQVVHLFVFVLFLILVLFAHMCFLFPFNFERHFEYVLLSRE